MSWETTVKQKRALRDAAVEQAAVSLEEFISGGQNLDALVPEHADIASLTEKLSTGELSAETLVSVTISR
jgi:hypothetical protein